jgi:hypothetical protein
VKWDFRHHLLTQIEMLRGDISHEELSERLGDVTERCLARYIAGKSHLMESEFREIAKALSMDAQVPASAWASSLDLCASSKDAVSWMVSRAYRRWRQHSRVADRSVPSRLSPMAVIRAKYADRLPTQTPLWFGSYSRSEKERDTPVNRARFVGAYEMLVGYVHGGQPEISEHCAVSAGSERGNSWCVQPTRGPGESGSTSLTSRFLSRMKLDSSRVYTPG